MPNPDALFRCERLAEDALLVTLGEAIGDETARRVRAFARAAARCAPNCEVVPAFASVALIGEEATPDLAATILAASEADDLGNDAGRLVEIPVCYGGEFGPDLEDIARHAGLPFGEVVARHANAEYTVDALGFAPGFPYLRGLDPRLAIPRRATPRTGIPAGSVGIGGAQTGVYPLASPGGWHLLGRTPIRLFRPENGATPTLLRPGDRVRFSPISPEEFARLAAMEDSTRPAMSGTGDVLARRGGMFTTLQTLVPRRWRWLGIAGGGAADARSLAVANALVGNDPADAALEITLAGPELVFARDATVALAGGEFDAWRNGIPMSMLRPVRMTAGDALRIGAARRGARGYLAVAGGFAAETALGSASTDVRTGLGGLAGQALRDGDRFALASPARSLKPSSGWQASRSFLPPAGQTSLRVLPGLQAREFPDDWEGREWTVSPASDRMGVRLVGEPLPRRAGAAELLSAAVLPGTVQVPPDGRPIVLGVDAGTIGGYPRIAQVIVADLPLIGQLRPGGHVRFRLVSLAEAAAARWETDRALALLRTAAGAKLSA